MLAGSYKVCCQLSLMFIFLVLISPVFITLMLVCLAIPTQPSLAVSEKRQVPETWNLKVAINKIIGRGEEKAQIEKILNQEGRVALVGAPGVGKTCLALHYARLKYQDYNIVWVINLANDLKSQLLELLVALDNLPRNALSNPFQGDACKTDLHTQLRDVSSNQLMFLVREKLRKTSKTWLLVLDDVRSRQTLYDLLPETHGDRTKHVLITSNNTKICESVIPLGVFTESEALAFLQLKLTRTYSKTALQDLGKFLELHPFVLNLAVATLNNDKSIDIEGYKNLFSQAAKRLFSRKKMRLVNNDSGEYDCAALEQSTTITLEKIRSENQQAYLLVCLLSLLDAADISTAIINQLNHEICQENRLFSPIAVLVQQSLLNCYDNGKTSYSMHKILRQVIQSSIDQATHQKVYQLGIRAFHQMLDREISKVAQLFSADANLLQHFLFFTKNADIEQLPDKEKLLKLQIKLIYYSCYYLRDYQGSRELYHRVKKDLDKAKLEDLELARLANLGSMLAFTEGNLSMAIQEALTAKDYLKNVQSDVGNKELVMTLTNNLGFYYLFRGQIEETEQLLQESKSFLKQQKDDESIGSYNFLLTQYWIDRGEFANALSTLAKIFAVMQRNKLLKDTFVFADIIKADILSRMNSKKSVTAAELAYRKAFNIYKTDDNEMVARSIVVLMNATPAQTFHLAKIQSAIKTYDDFYGGPGRNRRQAFAYQVLGNVFVELGKLSQALDAYQASEAIYESVLLHKQIDEVSSLYKSLAMLGIALKKAAITHKYLKKQIIHFGVQHPRTIDIMRYLDSNGLPLPL